MTRQARPQCKHLQKSEEAYVMAGEGTEPAAVMVCAYPDDEPGRFVDMPIWLLKQCAGGQMVSPERDCAMCPAYKEDAR